MKLRRSTPVRSVAVEAQTDYHKYRNRLADDFNHRCGYCGDKDAPRTQYYEIDHFVPKALDKTRITDYSNLVYACRSCNNAKRDKWPTGDVSIPNNGREGWGDPCRPEYDQQFTRSDLGKIIPVTELGHWMFENLKLWKKQHEILWMYEELDSLSNEFEVLYTSGRIKECHKDMFIRLLLTQKGLLKKLY